MFGGLARQVAPLVMVILVPDMIWSLLSQRISGHQDTGEVYIRSADGKQG
jgi:hypothetical protein